MAVAKTKREFVLDFRVVIDGDTAHELFDCLSGTMENVRDHLIEYGSLEVFKLRERKAKEPKP